MGFWTDETDNIVFGKLKQLNEQLTDLESERIVKEARYRIAASGDPELLATSAPDTTLQVLRTQQAALRAQYAQLREIRQRIPQAGRGRQ